MMPMINMSGGMNMPGGMNMSGGMNMPGGMNMSGGMGMLGGMTTTGTSGMGHGMPGMSGMGHGMTGMSGMGHGMTGMSGMGHGMPGMSGMSGMSGMGDMDMNMSSMCGMNMYFHSGFTEYILFEDLCTSTKGSFAGACIVVFLLAVLYEFLKQFRENLLRDHNVKITTVVKNDSLDARSQAASVTVSVDKHTAHERTPLLISSRGDQSTFSGQMTNGDSSIPVPSYKKSRCHKPRASTRSRMFSRMHLLQTLLHGLQIFISYCLMLIFMSYNAYLCLCVVLGAMVGYFLIGWNRTHIVDSNEHCH